MELAKEAKELLTLIAEDIDLLCILHDRELTKELIALLKENNFPYTLGLALEDDKSRDSLKMMADGLNSINQNNIDKELDTLAADFAGIYLNNSFSASPFESVWLDEDQLMMQQPMFELRDCYQKYGLKVADWRARSDDHFVHQFEFISYILKLGKREQLTELGRFMDEHLLRWFNEFAMRVANRCDTEFYAGLAALSYTYINEIRDLFAYMLHEPRPGKEEIEARFAKPKTKENMQYIPGASVSW